VSVIDADAHVNEDPRAWTELAAARPGWLGAAKSGGRWVAEIDGKLYPPRRVHRLTEHHEKLPHLLPRRRLYAL
jgi:hypothetical protein